LETGRVSAEWFLVGGGGQEPSGAARSGARRKCR
jgi:hypothetical protein